MLLILWFGAFSQCHVTFVISWSLFDHHSFLKSSFLYFMWLSGHQSPKVNNLRISCVFKCAQLSGRFWWLWTFFPGGTLDKLPWHNHFSKQTLKRWWGPPLRSHLWYLHSNSRAIHVWQFNLLTRVANFADTGLSFQVLTDFFDIITFLFQRNNR